LLNRFDAFPLLHVIRRIYFSAVAVFRHVHRRGQTRLNNAGTVTCFTSIPGNWLISRWRSDGKFSQKISLNSCGTSALVPLPLPPLELQRWSPLSSVPPPLSKHPPLSVAHLKISTWLVISVNGELMSTYQSRVFSVR